MLFYSIKLFDSNLISMNIHRCLRENARQRLTPSITPAISTDESVLYRVANVEASYLSSFGPTWHLGMATPHYHLAISILIRPKHAVNSLAVYVASLSSGRIERGILAGKILQRR